MVPAALVELARLPLSSNGKIDRKALPDPEFASAADYEPPTGRRGIGARRRVVASARRRSHQSPRQLLRARWRFHPESADRGERAIGGLSAHAATALRASDRCATRHGCCSRRARFRAERITPVAENEAQSVPEGPVHYPLSPLQRGLLFHSLQEPSGSAYVNQLRVDIDGLDIPRFKAAWQAIVDRHDVLRSAFLHQQEPPLAHVLPRLTLSFLERDWSDRVDLHQSLQELASAQRTEPFDLTTPPLMRVALVRIGEQRHHLIWTHHHLLMDGWSLSQLTGELLHHYHTQRLPELTGSYRDYVRWLSTRDAAASEAYWKSELQRLDEPTSLLSALSPSKEARATRSYRVSRTAKMTARLIAFAKRERVTLNTVIQAAWALLLSRVTGQSCVTFGATTSGRPAELTGVGQLIGLFINTLPVIVAPQPELKLGAWLRELQTRSLRVREHERTRALRHSAMGRLGQSLFDTLLVFENFPVDEALRRFADPKLIVR